MTVGNGHAGNGHRLPLVSVITTLYNAERYVGDCIRSVLASVTLDRFLVEHIIVDDGSSDDSVVRVRELAHPGLTLIPMPANSGRPAYGRNMAMRRATGDFVFCLDADDILLQNTLRYFLDHFREHPHSQWAYGDFLRCDSRGSYVVGEEYYGWPHASPESLLYSVFKGDHFYQHSFMARRELMDRVGWYDPTITYGEDMDLCVRFVLAGCMPTHLRMPTHMHRNHGANLTAHFDHQVHLEDVRNHYDRFRKAIRARLSPQQIAEIEEAIGYAAAAGTTV